MLVNDITFFKKKRYKILAIKLAGNAGILGHSYRFEIKTLNFFIR